MKKKRIMTYRILCCLLAVALLVSILALRAAKKETALLQAEYLTLSEKNQQLSNLNEALRLQLDQMFLSGSSGYYVEEDYCSLLVDEWSVENGVLSFDAIAQVFLTTPVELTAKLELWRGDTVSSAQPIELRATEASTVLETELSASFQIPDINAGEELQLWLTVEPSGGDMLFACAASWHLENGELVIITG